MLQLTEDAPAEDFSSFESTGAEFPDGDFLEFRTFTEGQASDPNLQGDIYGVKINFGSTGDNFTVSFHANRLPMWGDIHIKGAQSEAWNSDFGVEAANPHDYLDNHAVDAGGNELAKLLVPNSIIPEPGALALLGLGSLALLGRSRQFRQS